MAAWVSSMYLYDTGLVSLVPSAEWQAEPLDLLLLLLLVVGLKKIENWKKQGNLALSESISAMTFFIAAVSHEKFQNSCNNILMKNFSSPR